MDLHRRSYELCDISVADYTIGLYLLVVDIKVSSFYAVFQRRLRKIVVLAISEIINQLFYYFFVGNKPKNVSKKGSHGTMYMVCIFLASIHVNHDLVGTWLIDAQLCLHRSRNAFQVRPYCYSEI